MLGWCFVDWNLALNKQASAQGIYLYCLKAAEKIAEMLGDGEKTPWLKADYEKKKQAALNCLYDQTRGLFISGAEKQVSWASQIWMVLGGVLRRRVVLRRVEEAEAVTMVTPYLYHHYVQALLAVGEKDEALQVLTDYWGGHGKGGRGYLLGALRPRDPNTSPYGGAIVNSYCHAWSCAPAYFLRKYFS